MTGQHRKQVRTSRGEVVLLAPFGPGDEKELYTAYAHAVEDGGAFPRTPPVTEATFRSVWREDTTALLIARLEGQFAGAYFVRPMFADRGSHIANAAYLVAKGLRRRGIGRALLDHSLQLAGELGFDAMMFNLVQESNPSRKLWESASFREIGRIPEAIDGEDALIYWRKL
jgi:ribosomal protein S18 acetylase RimI-like enzyme